MKTLGTFFLKEKDEIETKISRGSLPDKDVWETLKNQLQGQESYTEIHLMTFLYATKLKEDSLDVNCHVKSIQAVCRRFNDVDLKLPEKLVVFISLVSPLLFFGTQRRILESRKEFPWRLSRKTFCKKL
jgi:hypothetical protein